MPAMGIPSGKNPTPLVRATISALPSWRRRPSVPVMQKVQPTAQPERFIVPMLLEGRRTRLEVTANSVLNPFRLREIQQFRCPGSL